MELEFERIGWKATFVQAVDGRDVSDIGKLIRDGILNPDHEGLSGPMSPGDVACCLSHEKVWKLIAGNKERCAMICEDDIRFREPLVDLSSVVTGMPADCDLLYLYYLNSEPNGFTDPAFDSDKHNPIIRAGSYKVFSAWSCGGTQCYLITAQGVEKALSSARPIKFPIDGYLGRLGYERRLNMYAVDPVAAESGFFRTTTR